MIKALDTGFLSSIPEITSALLRKYPPPSVPMIKGHLDQVRKNEGSIQPVAPITTLVTISPAAITGPLALQNVSPPAQLHVLQVSPPPAEPLALRPGARTHHIYTRCVAVNSQVFTDQTGRFPTKSTSGSTDIMVLYDYDINSIHYEPIPSRSA